MHSKDYFTGTGRFGRLILIIFLLLVFLNGCGAFRQKRVTPPPARPTAGKPPAQVPDTAVKKRYPVAKPPGDGRYIVTKPPVDRPLATKPPVEERPLVTGPPEEEPSAVRPPAEERPAASKPSVEERPVASEPSIEERPLAAKPPAEERPAVTEPPAEPPGEELPAVSSADYKPVTGKAAAIYNQAEEAMQAGKYSSAELLLERALRIEPRNGHYWYTLGLAKFRQKQYPQAVQFCLKADSLAGSQPGLMARNQVLLAHAKKAAGMK